MLTVVQLQEAVLELADQVETDFVVPRRLRVESELHRFVWAVAMEQIGGTTPRLALYVVLSAKTA